MTMKPIGVDALLAEFRDGVTSQLAVEYMGTYQGGPAEFGIHAGMRMLFEKELPEQPYVDERLVERLKQSWAGVSPNKDSNDYARLVVRGEMEKIIEEKLESSNGLTAQEKAAEMLRRKSSIPAVFDSWVAEIEEKVAPRKSR